MEKVLIGMDINDKYTQISYFHEGEQEAVTVSMTPGEQKYQIPTLLCRKNDGGKFLFGVEAKRAATLYEGILVNRLLERGLKEEEVEIAGRIYDGAFLLEEFIRQVIHTFLPGERHGEIGGIVFTIPAMNEEARDLFHKIGETIGIPKDCVFVQDYEESFYYYVVNQPEDLWKYEVVLFYYENQMIQSFELMRTEKKDGRGIRIESGPKKEMNFPEDDLPVLSEEEYRVRMDKEFLSYAKEVMEKKFVSTVFLVGDGFEGEWENDSLSYLCTNRKVFLGKNLFTKGACLAACNRLLEGKKNPYSYLGKNKVKADVGLNLCVKGTEQQCVIVHGGEDFRESYGDCEVIAGDAAEIKFWFHELETGKTMEELVPLEGLPDRPNKTLRLHIEVGFSSETCAVIKITDAGFGAAFPPSEYDKEVEISWIQ